MNLDPAASASDRSLHWTDEQLDQVIEILTNGPDWFKRLLYGGTQDHNVSTVAHGIVSYIQAN